MTINLENKILLVLAANPLLADTICCLLQSAGACVETIWDGGRLDGIVCEEKYTERIGELMIEALRKTKGSVVIIFAKEIVAEKLTAGLFAEQMDCGIRVNRIITDFSAVSPEKVASMTGFLLSPLSASVNGEILDLGVNAYIDSSTR